jgi:hypothetical protein
VSQPLTPSRRAVLAGLGIGLCAIAGAARAAASATATCREPAALPLSQKSRRRGLGYVEISTDAKRSCALCAFYSAAAQGCGACQILGGGIVSANGLCNSFAPRKG